jgi:hypothetical protein
VILKKTLKFLKKSFDGWVGGWYSIFTMKHNSKVVEYVKQKLGTDTAWVIRAIVKLYELQTLDEKSSGQTSNLNGVGFNSTDSFILSSFAEQINKGRTLSVKQLNLAFKKLPKYNKQIINCIPTEKLNELESKI